MATLVKEKVVSTRLSTLTTAQDDHELRSNVPAPFPRDLAQEILDELAVEDVGLDSLTDNAKPSTSRARLTVTVPADNAIVNVRFILVVLCLDGIFFF